MRFHSRPSVPSLYIIYLLDIFGEVHTRWRFTCTTNCRRRRMSFVDVALVSSTSLSCRQRRPRVVQRSRRSRDANWALRVQAQRAYPQVVISSITGELRGLRPLRDGATSDRETEPLQSTPHVNTIRIVRCLPPSVHRGTGARFPRGFGRTNSHSLGRTDSHGHHGTDVRCFGATRAAPAHRLARFRLPSHGSPRSV